MKTKTGLALQSIRKALRFSSARSFYHFLKKRSRVEFNYSYYVRIENGKILPSQKVISDIANSLEKLHASELILGFCADQFPDYRELFPTQSPYVATQSPKTEMLVSQKTLTERQIAILSRSIKHYHLFLLFTLARKPLPMSLLPKHLSDEHSLSAIRDLISCEILGSENDLIYSTCSEFRIPEATNNNLRMASQKFREWDQQLDQSVTTNSIYNKTFIRRMSPQYLSMICGHIELLFQFIRTAEQMNPLYNDEVVKIYFKVSNGRLPG